MFVPFNTHFQLRNSKLMLTLLVVFQTTLVSHNTLADSLVTLNTGALNGNGSYYLDFQLLDGNGSGDGNSLAMLSNLSITGANLGVALPSTGTVSGNPTQLTGLTLKDSDPNADATYLQPFTVNSSTSLLSFNVHLSTVLPKDAPIPDVFNLIILKGDGVTPLSTLGPTGVELLSSIDFTAPGSGLTSYGTDAQSSVSLTAPSIQPIASIPLPSAIYLFGSVLIGMRLFRQKNPEIS